MESLVPAVLFTYLTLFKPHFTKPSFVYFGGYILSLLITGGHKTMNHVAHTCFWVDRHLSSWERFLAEYRWDPTALLGTLLEALKAKLGQELMVHGAFLAVVDTLLIAKNGRCRVSRPGKTTAGMPTEASACGGITGAWWLSVRCGVAISAFPC